MNGKPFLRLIFREDAASCLAPGQSRSLIAANRSNKQAEGCIYTKDHLVARLLGASSEWGLTCLKCISASGSEWRKRRTRKDL
jgi:hypothetical protein